MGKAADGLLLEKLELVVTVVAAIVMGVVSFARGAGLYDLASTLVPTILCFYCMGLVLKRFLMKTVFKTDESAEEGTPEGSEDEKEKEKENGGKEL